MFVCLTMAFTLFVCLTLTFKMCVCLTLSFSMFVCLKLILTMTLTFLFFYNYTDDICLFYTDIDFVCLFDTDTKTDIVCLFSLTVMMFVCFTLILTLTLFVCLNLTLTMLVCLKLIMKIVVKHCTRNMSSESDSYYMRGFANLRSLKVKPNWTRFRVSFVLHEGNRRFDVSRDQTKLNQFWSFNRITCRESRFDISRGSKIIPCLIWDLERYRHGLTIGCL